MEIFNKSKPLKSKPIIGKVTLFGLPGSAQWQGSMDHLTDRAEQEATALITGGVDGLLIEANHLEASQMRSGSQDPICPSMDRSAAIAMALLIQRLRSWIHQPIGISLTPHDPESALAITLNTTVDFIRFPLLSGALLTRNGIVNSRLEAILAYQKHLKMDLPPLWVDISYQHLLASPLLASYPRNDDLAYLIGIAQQLPKLETELSVILSDEKLDVDALNAFQEVVPYEVIVENKTAVQAELQGYFDGADAFILDQGLRRQKGLQPDIPPTIDMVRVEEKVNSLRKIPTLSEMDPDIFLQR